MTAPAEVATSLRERARQADAAAVFQRMLESNEDARRDLERRRTSIVQWMLKYFDLNEADLSITDDAAGGNSAIAEADGLRFQAREHYEDEYLYVGLPCQDCGANVWRQIGRWRNSNPVEDLGNILSTPTACEYNTGCQKQPPKAATVDGGRTAVPNVGPALEALERAGDALAEAVQLEQEYEDRRGPEKGAAVQRIMAARGLAATPAEKIVEEDPHYAQFCADRRNQVAVRIRAEATYASAKISAQLAAKIAAVGEVE